mmetsp:Transcript_20843/g.45601  ORF Transcript_20843/g.45601 Transcript_20843/m.45601 type:complete len:131 (-) Transcript_20843:691-1083(-)
MATPEDVKADVEHLASTGLVPTIDDPFLVVKLNRAALQARHPAMTPAQREQAFAAILTQPPANLRNVQEDAQGTLSNMIFAGTMNQCTTGINAMATTPWMRPAAGIPDVGHLWLVSGINDINSLVVPLNA